VEGQTGLRDEGLTDDGRFLYAIDADAGRVLGWEIGDRVLTRIGSWETSSRTIAGLAAN
jgi:6-phosphogluconolactonase